MLIVRYWSMIYKFLQLLLACWMPFSCSVPTPGGVENEKPNQTSSDQFLTLSDHRIHFRDEGEGPVILLLHGGYLDLSSWDQTAEFLIGKGFRVLRYSELGHGLTERGETEAFAEEVIGALLQTQGVDSVSLVGLSWGATLAIEYALKFPNRVKHLILVSPGIKNWAWYQDTVAASNAAIRRQRFIEGDTIGVAEMFHQTWVIGQNRGASELNDTFVKATFAMVHDNFRFHWGEGWSSLDTLNITGLSNLNAPILLLSGSLDVSDIHQIIDRYKMLVPHSQHVKLPDESHLIHLENPHAFHEILLPFLQTD